MKEKSEIHSASLMMKEIYCFTKYFLNNQINYWILKMNEWISVKDRFPENKILPVLVTNVIDMYVVVYSDKEINDWQYSSCCGCSCSGITHWMPLPEPPK